MTTTVLIADPFPLCSDALAIALRALSDFHVLDQRPTSGTATIGAVHELNPDVAVIDFWMPEAQGPEITRRIRSERPQCEVILLSWISAPHHIQASLEAGAAAFLSEEISPLQLVGAIREVMEGAGPALAKQVQDLINRRNDSTAKSFVQFESLTRREVEVLKLLSTGQTALQIADRLEVSLKTVRNHISQILDKTDCEAAGEALAKARACGFLTG